MRLGSLFSGIGGLELGLERAGLGPVVYQVESDPFCRQVLARHWPHAERFTDVRLVRGRDLPAVDVICGGFPCQDVSDAGLRAGLDGDRSGLWYEFARILGELRQAGKAPRAVVIENVRGLLRRGLDRVVADLDELGFAVEATRILASDVGAPHRRERIFLVAVADADGAGRVEQRRRESGSPSAAVGAGRQSRGPLADGDGDGCEIERVANDSRVGGAHGHLADGRGAGRWGLRANGELAAAEPGVGGGADGVPLGLAGPGPGGAWPALRGEDQHEWEPARLVRRCAERADKLRALGNAVVPQVGYVVGLRVLERIAQTGDG